MAAAPTLEHAITLALAHGDEQSATVLLRQAFGGDGRGDEAELPELLEELTEYFVSVDRPEDAIAAASRAVLMTPRNTAEPEGPRRRCRIAEVLLNAGLPDEACAVYAAVAEEAAGETWVHEAAGSDYIDAGEFELGYAWLTAGLEIAVAAGEADCIARLQGLRRLSMTMLAMPLDDLDRRAAG